MAAVVDSLVSALDGLCAVDAARLGDGETIMALHRQLERLHAVTTRAVAAFDAGGSWEADGARTASAWVAGRCRLPVPSARRRLHLGRALRHMPVAERAWLAGDVGEAQVGLMAGARTPATAACFARDEALLVEQAGTLRYAHFARCLAYWAQLADPDGCEADAERQQRERRLHLSQSFGGTWVLNGRFDPMSGAIVAEALRRIDEELFAADWAEAKARVGAGVCAGDLARTPAQRRADALVEMARRSAAVPAGARLPEPLLSVLVGYETFAGRICELANGSVVTPGSVTRWLDRAWVERVVFDGPGRVSDVGVRRRLFTGATRRAVQIRDRECFHDLCDVPAEQCEVDHVTPWSQGGPTTEDNGRAACGFHNRARAPAQPPPAV